MLFPRTPPKKRKSKGEKTKERKKKKRPFTPVSERFGTHGRSSRISHKGLALAISPAGNKDETIAHNSVFCSGPDQSIPRRTFQVLSQTKSSNKKETSHMPAQLRHGLHTPEPEAPSGPGPNPVVRLLATRAGTDRELKDALKAITTGTATREQFVLLETTVKDIREVVGVGSGLDRGGSSSAGDMDGSG